MLIVNADDWGGWPSATDAIRACFEKSRITSASAMVFMEDSERAAALAKAIGLDVGLHINLNQAFSGNQCPEAVRRSQDRLSRYFSRSKYAQVIYNPFLRQDFRQVYEAQAREFVRLYGQPPSRVDGHRHLHLSANMLIDKIIPAGQKVRRSFSFWPGEKSFFNRAYRRLVDRCLMRRYCTTDYFFALSQCVDSNRLERVVELAKVASVELMTHPEKPREYEHLMGDQHLAHMQNLRAKN